MVYVCSECRFESCLLHNPYRQKFVSSEGSDPVSMGKPEVKTGISLASRNFETLSHTSKANTFNLLEVRQKPDSSERRAFFNLKLNIMKTKTKKVIGYALLTLVFLTWLVAMCYTEGLLYGIILLITALIISAIVILGVYLISS